MSTEPIDIDTGTDQLLCRIEDGVAVITLNRPEALNALNAEVMAALDRLFDEVAAGDARALLITGAGGRAFCAGADITGLLDTTPLEHRRKMHDGQRIMAKLDTLPQASVAVIDGYAFGGGLELALSCSFRLATPAARLGLPEVKLGLVPGYGGTQRLPRLIGESRALDMVMTGRAVDAAKALRFGLVDRIVSANEPMADAAAFVAGFAGYGMPALRLGRAFDGVFMHDALVYLLDDKIGRVADVDDAVAVDESFGGTAVGKDIDHANVHAEVEAAQFRRHIGITHIEHDQVGAVVEVGPVGQHRQAAFARRSGERPTQIRILWIRHVDDLQTCLRERVADVEPVACEHQRRLERTRRRVERGDLLRRCRIGDVKNAQRHRSQNEDVRAPGDQDVEIRHAYRAEFDRRGRIRHVEDAQRPGVRQHPQ